MDKNTASGVSISDLFHKLNTSDVGLTTDQANLSLAANGPNTLNQEHEIGPLIQLLGNFKNPLVLVLICVSVLFFFIGQKIDSVIVFSMVVMSVSLNFFQEYKAATAAKRLSQKVAPTAQVYRNGTLVDIPAVSVVVGDVIELNAGDLIPADARVIAARDFFVNQSSLTGESFPVEKQPQSLSGVSDLNSYTNLVFMGTAVLTGTAKIVVYQTGLHTEFGKISQKLVDTTEQNEFTQGINQFSYLIMKIILFFVLFIFLVNALLKHDALQSLLFAISVAVGLTPEFLPMIMSVTMSSGSVNMAKKGVIVKRLTAIPTFGSMDILCTDKTGTLTQDHIQLIKYTDPLGGISEDVYLYAYLNSHYQSGITNPMDTALVEHRSLDVSLYKKIDEIPFDFQRRKMSVVVSRAQNKWLITKGAPEEILAACSSYRVAGHDKPVPAAGDPTLLNQYVSLSRDGFRVLAIAIKPLHDSRVTYSKQDETGLTLLGFISFLDPAKPGVKQAIDELEDMGVEIKVITGDNEMVAEKICHDVDINNKGTLVSTELASLSDDQLRQRILNTTVFARFSPSQKSRIIDLLRTTGHVVGYLGDGINDAPSLKAADVGISVSNAVDVAKDSADIILTNKSLHELRAGVLEGRKTFGNTMKYIMMGLSSNFGNMFSVLGAVILLPFLPMLPIQILLNNFLYDFSQITIPSDHVDSDFVKKPKHWDIKFIRNFMFVFGPISSVFDYLTFFLLYLLFKNSPSLFQTGWFIESLATQTLVIHVIRTRKLPLLQSSASILLTITTLASVLVGWSIPFTPLGKFFEFTPLPWPAIFGLVGIVIAYLFTVELGKKIFYNRIYPN